MIGIEALDENEGTGGGNAIADLVGRGSFRHQVEIEGIVGAIVGMEARNAFLGGRVVGRGRETDDRAGEDGALGLVGGGRGCGRRGGRSKERGAAAQPDEERQAEKEKQHRGGAGPVFGFPVLEGFHGSSVNENSPFGEFSSAFAKRPDLILT